MKAGNIPYKTSGQLPDTVPVFPLTGAILLPGSQIPLNIFEPRYLKMVEDAMCGSKLIGMIQPCLRGQMIDPKTPKLSKIGCLGRLTTMQETGDGRYLIKLSGICRFQVIKEIETKTPYRQCNIKAFEKDLNRCENGKLIDREAVLSAFKKYLEVNEIEADWEMIGNTDNTTLVNALSMMCSYEPAEKQALLESDDICERAKKLVTISQFHIPQCPDGKPHKLN